MTPVEGEGAVLSGQSAIVSVGGRRWTLQEPTRRTARRMQLELMPIYKTIQSLEAEQQTSAPDNVELGRLALLAAGDIADFFEAHQMVQPDALEVATEEELLQAFTAFAELLNRPFAVRATEAETETPTPAPSPDSTS